MGIFDKLFSKKSEPFRLISEFPTNLEIGKPCSVETEKGEMLAVKTASEVVFFKDKCPHAGGKFSLGNCTEQTIECPLHRFKYDLTTGKGHAGQGDYIRLYTHENGFLIEKNA